MDTFGKGILFALGFFGFCFIMLIRNQIIFEHRCRAIREGLYDTNPDSYEWMLFQFTKWTYKQFYKESNRT